MTAYDSTADTLRHSRRVGELVHQVVKDLLDRAVTHDLSKTEPPELAFYDEFGPKIAASAYGSDEYYAHVEAMRPGLIHHYAANRHHVDHFTDGIAGMTLVDLVEMLADWRAATERNKSTDFAAGLAINRKRYGIDDQLWSVLWNTAEAMGWLPERVE